MLPVRLSISLVTSFLAVFCLSHGLWVVGSVWALITLPLISRRVAVELFLGSLWVLLWLNESLNEPERYYWYAKASKCGRCDDIHATPVYGSIQGKMWMNFWRDLNCKTFPIFAAAVRTDLTWHNEKESP